jgi:hypothetical protein
LEWVKGIANVGHSWYQSQSLFCNHYRFVHYALAGTPQNSMLERRFKAPNMGMLPGCKAKDWKKTNELLGDAW